MSSAADDLQSEKKPQDSGTAKKDGGDRGGATGGGMPRLGTTGIDFVDRLIARVNQLLHGDEPAGQQGGPQEAPPEEKKEVTPEQQIAKAKEEYQQVAAEEKALSQKEEELKKTRKELDAELKKLKAVKKPTPEQTEKLQQVQESIKQGDEELVKVKEEQKNKADQKKQLVEQINTHDVKEGKDDAAQQKEEATKKLAELEESKKQIKERKDELNKLLKQKAPKGATAEEKAELEKQKAAARQELKELAEQEKTEAKELKETKSTVNNLKQNKGKAGSLWVNVNIAGPLSSAMSEVKAATGIDITGNGASALRGIQDDGSGAGRIYCSWHKTGRAVDFSQKEKYVRIPDGNKFRLYLLAKDGGTGVPGSSLGKASYNPYKGNKDFDTMQFVDVTAAMEMHGFNRIPPNGSVEEWWHYEMGGGKTWYEAMIEMYPEDQFMPLLKQHVQNGIVKQDYLVKHGVPKAKLTAP